MKVQACWIGLNLIFFFSGKTQPSAGRNSEEAKTFQRYRDWSDTEGVERRENVEISKIEEVEVYIPSTRLINQISTASRDLFWQSKSIEVAAVYMCYVLSSWIILTVLL